MQFDPLKFSIPLTKHENEEAIRFLKNHKVAIFVVAYEAESYIENLLLRIPKELLPFFAEIFIIDDFSQDKTFEIAQKAKEKLHFHNLNVFRTPHNRGYGGNQKLGYLYSIVRGYDVVILLHGDAQYPPEYLARLLAPFNNEKVDAVFASRMITKKAARKGGMPLYKWLGNQVLTWFENNMLGTHLSEFHTGYRAYRTRLLKKLPFKYNNNGFHFDTEIIIQVIASGGKIKEVPIPTHYGDEVCHVNGLKYAFNCVRSVIWYKLTRLGIFFDRRFDIRLFDSIDYSYKTAPNTPLQFIIRRNWRPSEKIIQFHAGSGRVADEIARKGADVLATDSPEPPKPTIAKSLAIDLNSPFDQTLGKHSFDTAIMLEGLEHYNKVGDVCERVAKLIKPGGAFYVCSANILYLPLRIMFLLGNFRYGKRGILDVTHTRLFTRRSLVRLLQNSGFKVVKVYGFGPPLRDMISKGWFVKMIDSILHFFARLRPSLFAYQIMVEAEKLDDVETILEQTINSSN